MGKVNRINSPINRPRQKRRPGIRVAVTWARTSDLVTSRIQWRSGKDIKIEIEYKKKKNLAEWQSGTVEGLVSTYTSYDTVRLANDLLEHGFRQTWRQ